MARLNVNPTRMELKRLKARLATAKRGHKLLKDKSDEMIRVFSALLRETRRLRAEIEGETAEVFASFAMAVAAEPRANSELAFSVPSARLNAECGVGSVLGVDVPKIDADETAGDAPYPYAFARISSEADAAVGKTASLVRRLLLLAEKEKTARILAFEIEKNKRRVNALEHVMIPQLEETIRYIAVKLDENERGNLARLMKVKSMLGGE